MSGHTPGGWFTERREGSHRYITAGGWNDAARCAVMLNGEPSEEGEANATLIAAAPDLLAACEELLLLILHADRSPILPPDLEYAREAIALATGEKK